eukprot:Skav218524  [mRNA]  locus=scaffold2478:249717:253493:- [translate_table: standard]
MEEAVRASCVEMCSIFHSQTTELAVEFKNSLKRIYYATPTSFLELIQTFKTLLGGKRKQAMPALTEALGALDTLSAKDIGEIKAMKNPPGPDESGKMVEDFWGPSVKMVGESDFLRSLQSFDKDGSCHKELRPQAMVGRGWWMGRHRHRTTSQRQRLRRSWAMKLTRMQPADDQHPSGCWIACLSP